MPLIPKRDFLQHLKREVVVGDGAMGTRLYEAGYDFHVCYEELNLKDPSLIEKILRHYVQSGAQAIETNTFCGNRNKLQRHNLGDQTEQINYAAAQLARKTAGTKAFVLGSIGPLRNIGEELTPFSDQEQQQLFSEQAKGLHRGGVDAFILETFLELPELENATKAVRSHCDLPIIAQMAFSSSEVTPDNYGLEEMVRRLRAAGADVIGANCLTGPALHLEIVERLANIGDFPISSYANAGYPQQIDGRFVYGSTPAYFGKMAIELVKRGARLIGGCCGTTPQHITAIQKALGKPLADTEKTGGGWVEEITPEIVERIEDEPTKAPPTREAFLEMMKSTSPFLTVEVEPPKGIKFDPMIEKLKAFIEAGVNTLNISDNPLASVRMDSMVFAGQLKQHIDLPVIVHLTCRDRNILALQSTLLGAQSLGIESILALTGDPASVGLQPGAKSVYNTNSIGLVRLIQQLNQGHPPSGFKAREKTNFAIGVALNPHSMNLDAELRKLNKKMDEGADFIQTQPLFHKSELDGFLSHVANIKLPILLGVLPLLSYRSAEYIHNEIPGIKIPDIVRERLQGMNDSDAEIYGQDLACELMEAAQGHVQGFYLITPQRRYAVILDIIKYIKKLD